MKKHKKIRMAIPTAGMIAGIAILSYPFVSNMINSVRNEQAVSSMISVYDRYEDNAKEIEGQRRQAELFNIQLAGDKTDIPAVPYEEQLSFDGNGIMGYIDIPKINLKMPVYHGTSDEVLAAGAGHLENTSLPVGGRSTHSVISGHSGMKEMRAFDDLRKLDKGDEIIVGTLGEVLTYRVTYSETVLPEDTDSLQIEEGKDLLTLVTCTPYGINDHRLLVHSERVASSTEADDESFFVNDQDTDTGRLKTVDLRVASFFAAILAAACFAGLLFIKKKRCKVTIHGLTDKA